MELTERGIIFVKYPISKEQVIPYRSVLNLSSKQEVGGQLTVSYADAFKMGFAGVIDRAGLLQETEREIVATLEYMSKVDDSIHTMNDIDFLRAEKYFIRACEKLDFECISDVGRFLITQPIVSTKKAISEDLIQVCDQIEWTETCSLSDVRNTLFELKRHVFCRL